ncbi:hypothetical protein F7D01_07355 [Erythrobacter sp. 3-20A1M]|uniref:hypothetical protein n=1 Tax=Erythrobacter sp. 3-20A1M TaxID=2653850 RepID=UPI001BFC37DC|nr:hypothetical protein [Erythrobacter sp. 3-20A1M]QWC56936.1 hypothetical protein F7D01_07355 [Erythrobacter sp. 3-20A1M]
MTASNAERRTWEEPFLAALRRGGSVAEAFREAGVERSTAYHRRRHDARLARAWDAAREAGQRKALRGQTAPPPPHWRAAFLEELAHSSSVSASARAANVPVATAYKKRRDDPAFARKWRAALHEGYEHLEMEVLAHLRGNLPDRRIDVANAIRLLAAHRQTIAEIRASQDERSEEEVIASINDLIDRMRREDGDLPPEDAHG